MAKILGIDLGTTNSAMAIMEGGEPRVLENAEGQRTTPSVVAIAKNGERLVGTLAKRQAVTNPKNTIYGIKRFMGHAFKDDVVQKDKDIVPYGISAGDGGGVQVTLAEKNYRPEEISAMILGKLKADAESKLGEKITEAVITVPAYFDDSQRITSSSCGTPIGLGYTERGILLFTLYRGRNRLTLVVCRVRILHSGCDICRIKDRRGACGCLAHRKGNCECLRLRSTQRTKITTNGRTILATRAVGTGRGKGETRWNCICHNNTCCSTWSCHAHTTYLLRRNDPW